MIWMYVAYSFQEPKQIQANYCFVVCQTIREPLEEVWFGYPEGDCSTTSDNLEQWVQDIFK